jgi:folate-dependent phosphoribosylglycinamide formyltransferase PurN|tara:strand:+ start:4986 stop:5924 length:939 start_codon:yes stop_codon:yes gene_type:complete
MELNNKQKYKISVTTALGVNSIFYIISLMEHGFNIHSIFVQTNRYRAKRERKKLKELGFRYLMTYLKNYVTYKVLKLPTSFKGYIYTVIYNTNLGKKLINKIKNKDDVKSLDQFKEIKQYELDYFTSLKIIKRVVKEANAPTQIIKTQKINGSDTEAFLKKNKIDILVISGGTIIRSNILNSISKCAITIHNSFLPYLRGWGGGEVWALIHDQKEALGTTIFYTEKGVDSGDILNQENLKIDTDDTIDTLRYKNIILGKKLIIQAIELLLSDNAPRMVQNNKYVTHINRRPNKNEKIIAIDNLEKWKLEIHK